LLNDYQTRVRPDAGRYAEQHREAMGDGSWRLTGLRQITGGTTQQVNTFIEINESTIGIIEVILDDAYTTQLETIINSFQLEADTALEPTDLNTLSFATSGRLEPLNIHTWTAPDGAFF
jgi:hypothetical protein